MLNKEENEAVAVVIEPEDILGNLEERGLVEYNENGQAVKVQPNRHLRDNECVALLLPLIIADIRISNRALEKLTGLDHRTIAKVRNSDDFLRALAIYTNKKVVGVRMIALDRLEKLLLDKSQNPNTLIKGIALALSHSERMSEIVMMAKTDKEVDISALIAELENM